MEPQQRDWEFELSQYIDGQLSGKRLAELEARLREDASLRELQRQYRQLQGRLESLAEADAPDVDYSLQRETIMGSLERKALLKQRVIRVPFIFRVSAGAMAAAAIVAITALVAISFLKTGPVTPQGPLPVAKVEIAAPHEAGEAVVNVAIGPSDKGAAHSDLTNLDWNALRSYQPEQSQPDAAGSVVVAQGVASNTNAPSTAGLGFDVD